IVLFYHSNCAEPGVVGLAAISKPAWPDPTQFDPKSDYYDPKSKREDPRWSCVEVKHLRDFPRVVTLADLRSHPALRGMLILRPGNRLSVTPVTAAEARAVESLARR
ncbi:MAG: EVE domain-containing protein, partial [Verrucomicrobiota bacterium]